MKTWSLSVSFALTILSLTVLVAADPLIRSSAERPPTSRTKEQDKRPSSVPLMPGRLVDIRTHRLHLWCEGSGSPAVILEAGLGAYSIDWSLVQPALTKRTRVCSYDRAGYAWSDRGPEPRGLGTSVNELHALLRSAGVSSPFILVGQSWGGRIVRIYADRYPGDVAGMVLIDTYSEGELDVPATVISALDLRPEAAPADSIAHLPADLRAARDWARSLPRQQDISDPDEPDAAIAATTARTATPLGDKPLVVVSAGRLLWGERDRATGPPYAAALQAHVRSEAFLASLSRNSSFRVARGSFHLVHLDEPALIIDAIEDVLMAARSGAKLSAR
jgi:pimeloyl-ACP methyl ester carboxylesterase